MDNIVKFKRSSVTDKLPLPSQLAYGELAVNFSANNPFLSIKNNQDQIEKFLSEKGLMSLLTESYYDKQTINQMFEAFDPSGEISFDNYYEKAEADAKFQTISGMSSYLTIAQAEQDYQPKGNYLTEHQSLENYYTKSEADNKFLTSHQDLSDYALKADLDDYLTISSASTIYATKEELEEHIPTVDAYTKAETDTLLAGKANSAHTHDYETLTNKPDLSNFATKGEIPDTSSFATKQELANYQPKGTYVVPSDLNNYVTSGYAEETFAKKGDVPTDVYTKSETDTLLAGKASSSHTHDYSEILNTPDVPKIWKGTLAEYTNLTDIDPDTLYVITDESEQFVTSGDVESMISGFTTLSEVEVLLGGYSTTAHTHDYSEIQNTPDLSGFASLSDIPDTSNFITSGFCEDRYQPKGTYVVPSDLNDYALKSDLPTVPDSYTKTETDNLLAGKANSAHTHDYETLTNKPDLSIYLTEHQDISGLATKQELENYMPNSGMTDYALKSEIPSIEGLATEAELANYQSISGMSEYSTTAHTHSYNDLTDKPTIPSTSGLASETWVSNNFAGTGHTHSQYLTQTSADSRYARVVSCTQAEYDALVQSDQVEQGVLYCIIEANS